VNLVQRNWLVGNETFSWGEKCRRKSSTKAFGKQASYNAAEVHSAFFSPCTSYVHFRRWMLSITIPLGSIFKNLQLIPQRSKKDEMTWFNCQFYFSFFENLLKKIFHGILTSWRMGSALKKHAFWTSYHRRDWGEWKGTWMMYVQQEVQFRSSFHPILHLHGWPLIVNEQDLLPRYFVKNDLIYGLIATFLIFVLI